MNTTSTDIRRKLVSFSMKVSQNNPWIFVILLLMLMFLIIGLNWGAFYHPDEIYRRSIDVIKYQRFNPVDYYYIPWGYPSGHIYLISILIGVHYLISSFLSYIGLGKFLSAFLYSRENAALIGRFVTLIMSLFAGFFVFQIGFEVGKVNNRNYLSILSAFFLATSNIWINNSHFGTTDVPMTLWLILGIYFLYTAKRNPNYYLIAGCMGGFALTTKWNAGLFLIVLIFELLKFVIWNREKHVKKRMIIGIGSVCCLVFCFLLGSPFFLLDFPNSYEYLIEELEKHDSVGPFQNILQVFKILVKGIGFFPTLIGFSFLFSWTFLRFLFFSYSRIKTSPRIIEGMQLEKLDIVGNITWIFIIFQLRRLEIIRDVIPIIPFFSIFIAYGVLFLLRFWISIFSYLKENSRLKCGKIIPFFGFFLTLAIVCVPSVAFTLYNSYSIQTDTRLQAEKWILNNIKEGSIIGVDTESIWYYFPTILKDDIYIRLEINTRVENVLHIIKCDYIILSSLWYYRFEESSRFEFYWGSLLNNKNENYTVVADFNRYILGYENVLPPMEFISPHITIIKYIGPVD